MELSYTVEDNGLSLNFSYKYFLLHYLAMSLVILLCDH